MTERIPEIIPNRCGDCVYFKRGEKSLLRFFWGKCEFYKEETHANYECIAVKKYGKTPTIPQCPNCRVETNLKAKFCKKCGTEISPKPMVTIAFCEKCKSVYDASAKFCDEDGSKLIQKELDQEDVQNPDPGELSFGWGNFWIFMGFLQGGIAFVLSVIMGIQTEYLPNRGIGLLISILGIGSAYGLMNKKLFGLYLIYANLIGIVVTGFIGLVSGDETFAIQGAIAIVASILWFIYFNKRKEMFN